MSKARQLADLGGDTANLEDISSVYSSGPLSNRNLIINGAMQVAQRGTSFTSDGYTLDRWYMSLGGSSGTVSQQSFTAGQTDVPDEPKNYLRFNISSYVGEFSVFTRVEDVRTLAGQTAVLSFYMKADSAVTVAPFIVQNFGSGGSSNVNSALSTINVTTSWQRFEVSFSVPSISGKTIGSSSYLQIMPLRVTSSFTGNIDIANVQLEVGDTATPFEHRSYGQELALCQRYYEKFGQGWWARFESGSQLVVNGQFKVEKRAAPSIGLPVGGTIRLYEWGVSDRDATPTLTSTAMAANGGHFKLSGFSSGGTTGEIWGVGGTPSGITEHPFEADSEL